MTGPEQRLWAALRAHRLAEIHFRRQVPIGTFVVDFASHRARLVVEVDGDQHGSAEGLMADHARDTWLARAGYRVLRFSNWQVMNEFESVVATIEAAVAPSLPSP